MAALRRQWRDLFFILKLSSLLSPEPLNGWRHLAFLAHKAVAGAACFYCLASMLRGWLACGMAFTYVATVLFLNLMGFLGALFFLLRGGDVRRWLDDAASLHDVFVRDRLRTDNRLKGRFERLHRKIQFWMKLRLSAPMLMVITNATSKLALYFLSGASNPEVILPPFYSLDLSRRPILYSLEMAFQLAVLYFNILLQCGLESFFLTGLLHTTVYFNYLRRSLPSVFKVGVPPPLERRLACIDSALEFVGRSEEEWEERKAAYVMKRDLAIRGNVKDWVILHEKSLALGHDIVKMFNPVLLIQFVYIYCTIVLSVNLVLQYDKDKNVYQVESVLVACYVLAVLGQFYVMCSIGVSLYHGSGRVFELGASCGWYESSKSVRICFLIVGEVAKRPVRVSLYHSEVFVLSRVTFEWVFRSMVSMALTLYQLRVSFKR